MPTPTRNAEGCFSNGLAQRWMGMAGAGQVLCAAAEFHGDYRLHYQLSRHGPDRMHSKNSICRSIGEYLYETDRVLHGPRTPIR